MDVPLHDTAFPRSLATLAVFAGGHGRRLGGYQKFLLPWGDHGQPLISHILQALSGDFAVSLVATNHAPHPAFGNYQLVPDDPPGQGPLGGLAAILAAAETPYVFAVACDMPLVRQRLVRHLVADAVSGDFDAVVPVLHGDVHPLHAVYHRRVLATLRRLLQTGALRMTDLLAAIEVHYVEEAALRQLDPSLDSLSNINTFGDLRRCRELSLATQEDIACS
jgi:molybdopterin-guanine dinucleotide biosynthesis protein A